MLPLSPAVKIGVTALPLFVAESTTDNVKSSAIGEWVVIAAGVLVIINVAWNFIDRVRGGSTEKREVTFPAQFASQADHHALKEEVTKIDSERRQSTANLHAKIDALAVRLDERIDEIPGRTIALLGETKRLHKS